MIANVFYRLDLIESYGTGIQKMLESYAGCDAAPQFNTAPASFVVALPNRNTSEKAGVVPELSREENVLRLLRMKGSVTRKEGEQYLGCSAFPAVNTLNMLMEQGKIIKTGAGRGTKYMLKK